MVLEPIRIVPRAEPICRSIALEQDRMSSLDTGADQRGENVEGMALVPEKLPRGVAPAIGSADRIE